MSVSARLRRRYASKMMRCCAHSYVAAESTEAFAISYRVAAAPLAPTRFHHTMFAPPVAASRRRSEAGRGMSASLLPRTFFKHVASAPSDLPRLRGESSASRGTSRHRCLSAAQHERASELLSPHGACVSRFCTVDTIVTRCRDVAFAIARKFYDYVSPSSAASPRRDVCRRAHGTPAAAKRHAVAVSASSRARRTPTPSRIARHAYVGAAERLLPRPRLRCFESRLRRQRVRCRERRCSQPAERGGAAPAPRMARCERER